MGGESTSFTSGLQQMDDTQVVLYLLLGVNRVVLFLHSDLLLCLVGGSRGDQWLEWRRGEKAKARQKLCNRVASTVA